MTWWTRHDSTEPELSDDETEEEPGDKPSEREKTDQDGSLKIEDQMVTDVVAKSRTY